MGRAMICVAGEVIFDLCRGLPEVQALALPGDCRLVRVYPDEVVSGMLVALKLESEGFEPVPEGGLLPILVTVER